MTQLHIPAYVPRAAIVTTAYDWIDTPYQHQASVKRAGCDCLLGQETLLEAAQKCLTPLPNDEVQAGDVLLFRMVPNAPCKHIAIMSAPDRIIHAYWGRAVVESYLVPYWTKRHVFSFSFPEIETQKIENIL